MPRKMKAAVCHAFGKPLTIEEVPIPEPKPGEILVKVQAFGVCHTDLHAISGDWPVKPKLPFIPGHEGAGVVAAVGSEVDFVKVGDRVGVPWLYSACGHCDYCMAGSETLCKDQKNTGYSVNGAFAEYEAATAATRRLWMLAGPNGAAARLGLKRSLLYRRMKKFGIPGPVAPAPWRTRPPAGAGPLALPLLSPDHLTLHDPQALVNG
jgi:D-arabinose 1-dehydrogenase-like Zn-dependent alcohol dehydrogenase